MPGSIVGAIANEGGISSAQIGGIDIRSDHSLVELPADLSADQLRALSRTRIGGELIHLELDNGRKPRRDRDDFGGGHRGGFRSDRADRPFTKKSDGDRPYKKKFDGDRPYKKNDGERSFSGDRTDRGGFGGDRDRSFGGPRKPRHTRG